jgi:predicted transcriptional regulator
MNFGSYYRDKISIFSDILEVANRDGGGALKTRIMYDANLSHDQLKYYVKILTENNLLYYDLHTQRFKATEKGLRVIEIYKRIESMVKAPQVLPTPALPQPPVQTQGESKTEIK